MGTLDWLTAAEYASWIKALPDATSAARRKSFAGSGPA